MGEVIVKALVNVIAKNPALVESLVEAIAKLLVAEAAKHVASIGQ